VLMDSGQLLAPAQLDDRFSQMALQLQAAEAELAQARRTHSEFLCAIGHELRSPLTAILGYAQLLDASGPMPTPRQKSSLAQILQGGWGLLAAIDQLLDASLIECGKLQLQMENVSLEDVLRECDILIEPLAHQSDVQVVFAWPEQPLLVAADRTRLRQILMTLLGHALLHSGAAGVVQVRCHRCADGRVRVHFRDTSSGQSAAWMSHSDPASHIKLIISQQLAGYMGGVIATEFNASTAGDARAYWLELDTAGRTP
jgi:signal transduction histidine kinase